MLGLQWRDADFCAVTRPIGEEEQRLTMGIKPRFLWFVSGLRFEIVLMQRLLDLSPDMSGGEGGWC